MIERIIEFPSKLSFFLFGPRQTGKSTLIQSRYRENLWGVNLLRDEVFLPFAREPHKFRLEAEQRIQGEGVQTIFVDEVQRVPLLLNEIQSLMFDHPACRFILTGSSARKLKRGGANLLAGRAVEMFLFPLTCTEIGSSFNLNNILTYGALPSVFDRDPIEKQQILSTYVNTYLREEIKSEGIAREIGGFSRFLEMAAAQFGELLNFTAIARECHLSARTVQSYYEILEDTLIGSTLMAWRKSVRKRLTEHPKFYFFDLGVTNAVNQRLSGPPDLILRGRLFEQFIFLETRARMSYKRSESRIFFWRTSNGAEVDLLFVRHDKILGAVEIKSSSNIATAHLSGLRAFRQEHPNVPLFLVSTAPNAYTLDGVLILPWRQFLEKHLDNLL